VRVGSNSGTEFRELSGDGIGRNCREFRPIPESNGIPRNSRKFRQFDGTRSVTSRSVALNDDRVLGIGRNWFRGQN
jgi:hypothetical protein